MMERIQKLAKYMHDRYCTDSHGNFACEFHASSDWSHCHKAKWFNRAQDLLIFLLKEIQ